MNLSELQLPISIYSQLTELLKSYQTLQATKTKLNKVNSYKDNFIQKLVILFRNNQTKILNRLKNLQTVNLKYMKDYANAKHQSNSNIKKRINRGSISQYVHQLQNSYNQFQGRNTTSLIYLNQQKEELSQLNRSMQNYSPSYSVFQSRQWVNLLQQLKQNETHNNNPLQIQNKIIVEDNPVNIRQHQNFHQKLFIVLEQYFLSLFNSNQNLQKNEKFDFVQIIIELIDSKKNEIRQNKQLRKSSLLRQDLKRLETLKVQIDNFVRTIKKQQNKKAVKNSKQLMFLQIFQKKKQIQQKLYSQLLLDNNNQNSLIDKNKVKQFKDQRYKIFDQFSSKFINSYLSVGDSEKQQSSGKSKLTKNTKHQIKRKIIQNISQKIDQKTKEKIQAKKFYEQKLQYLQESLQKDRQQATMIKIQNNQLKQKLKKLQNLKQKYQFVIERQQQTNNNNQTNFAEQNKNKVLSKKSSKLQKLLSLNSSDNDKQMLMQCLKKKDQLLQMQQKQIQMKQQKLQKFSNKIKTYFKQQGIKFNEVGEQNFQNIDIEDLLQAYSQQITKQNYQKYPQQKANLTKKIQQKFNKESEQIRQQYEQKIQNLQQELNVQKIQRQNAKLGQQSLQKQISKLKVFSQKLMNKRIDLQMIHSRTQQVVKNLMQTFFNYLLNQSNRNSNSTRESEQLTQQIQIIIQNIKLILKFKQKQRQKDRQNMTSYHPNTPPPVNIDYRFSGLSAVSNDFSFSKLNKESYLDYFDNNQDSEVIEQSEVLSKMSEQNDIVPPSRPSYSTTRQQKRQMGVIDIYQRATMAHQDQSVLTYINTNNNQQQKMNRNQTQKLSFNVTAYQGFHEQFIKFLQNKLQTFKNQIPQQTQHEIQPMLIQREDSQQLKQMYQKWKLTQKCLQSAQKINKDNQIAYQNFIKNMKQKGVFQTSVQTQKQLFYLHKTIIEQDKIIEQQKIQFQTTISQQVEESQSLMKQIFKSLRNK